MLLCCSMQWFFAILLHINVFGKPQYFFLSFALKSKVIGLRPPYFSDHFKELNLFSMSKIAIFRMCSILLLMLQHCAAAKNQLMHYTLRMNIANIFLTMFTSFNNFPWAKLQYSGFAAYFGKCCCIVQQQMKNFGARVAHEPVYVLRIPFM